MLDGLEKSKELNQLNAKVKDNPWCLAWIPELAMRSKQRIGHRGDDGVIIFFILLGFGHSLCLSELNDEYDI